MNSYDESAAGRVGGRHRAAMQANRALGDGQSQADSVLLAGDERLEEPLRHLGRRSRSRIRHLDDCGFTSLQPQFHTDRSTGAGGLDGVADDVQQTALGDLEILLGEEDIEMLDEELEFYGWLEEQPEFANAGDSVG